MTIEKHEPQVPSGEFELKVVPGSIKKAMETSHSKSRDLWQVPVENIRIIEGFNVRIKDDHYEEKVNELSALIEENGFRQNRPLAGYVAREGDKNVIYLTDGHRRYEGTRRAIARGVPIEVLPVVVSSQSESPEDLVVSLVHDNLGEPLRPYEQALVVKRLVRYGWTPAEISKRLKLSVQYVDNLLLLVAAPVAVRNMVIAGQVSAATAVDALRSYGDKAEEKLLGALDTVRDTVEKQGGGQVRVTKKHLSTPAERVAKLHGFRLFGAAQKIVEDPGLESLKPETQALIKAVLAEINTKVERAEKKAASTPSEEGKESESGE